MTAAVTVRPEQPADAPAVARVLAASFAQHDDEVAGVLHDLRASGDFRVGLVAERLDEPHGVVGYVALSRAWLDARERLVDVLVLSPLGVEPGHQGDGIGTALLAAAVDAAGSAGAPLLFLEGSPRYYGERGFVRASDHGILRPSDRIPDPACQLVLLGAHEPWMVGRLVYPDCWWRRGLVGLRDPELAEVEAALG